jgi:hypothetical protein
LIKFEDTNEGDDEDWVIDKDEDTDIEEDEDGDGDEETDRNEDEEETEFEFKTDECDACWFAFEVFDRDDTG